MKSLNSLSMWYNIIPAVKVSKFFVVWGNIVCTHLPPNIKDGVCKSSQSLISGLLRFYQLYSPRRTPICMVTVNNHPFHSTLVALTTGIGANSNQWFSSRSSVLKSLVTIWPNPVRYSDTKQTKTRKSQHCITICLQQNTFLSMCCISQRSTSQARNTTWARDLGQSACLLVIVGFIVYGLKQNSSSTQG